MKKEMVIWLGLLLVLLVLMTACSKTTPTLPKEEPRSAESGAAEQPAAPEEKAEPEVSVTLTPTAEVAADFTLPDGDGNMVNLENELQENEHVVLVFYYGSGCEPCVTQLSEIANDRAKYEEIGAQVIAVAVQGELNAKMSAKLLDAQFPILADSKRTVAEAFGVLENGGLSTPSVFIINKDGQIVWSEISHIEGAGCGTERVPSQTILENLQ